MYSKCSRTRRFFRIEDFLRIEDLFPIEDLVSQGTNLSEGKSQNTCFIDLFALAQICLGHNEKKFFLCYVLERLLRNISLLLAKR